MASSEGDQLLARAFHAIMDKIDSDILQTAKKQNWIVFIHQGFQKDSSYKCQYFTKVRAPSRLVSEVWAKYKDVPTKILKRFCKDKLRQTSQRNINVRKQRNFNGRDIISGYELLLSTLNSFSVGTEVYYPRCYYINDGESLQILY